MRIQDFFAACQHLTTEEFDLWIRLAGDEQDIRAAIIYLKALEPDAPDTANKAAIHHAAYPDLPYRTKRFHQLIDRLMALLELVIALDRLGKAPELKDRLLLEWEMDHGLEASARSTFALISGSENKEMPDERRGNLLDRLAASLEFYWWDLKMTNDLNVPLTRDIVGLIEHYLSVQSLSLELSLQSLAQWRGASVPFPFGAYLSARSAGPDDLPAVEIRLLQLAIRLNEHHRPADLEQFEQWLTEYGDTLDDHVRQLLHALRINSLIRLYNDDSTPEHMRRLLDAYKESADMGLLMNRNVLSYQTYLNVVTVAVACSDVDWAEAFVNRFREFVPLQYRDSAFAFNMGKIAFQKGNYDESLDWLQQARLRDSNQFYAVRQLVIRNYYAKKDWKAIRAVLNSLKMYAIRKMKADPSYHSVFRTNYVANIKRLLDIRLHPGDVRNAKRLEEIRQHNSTDHLWIKQQAEIAIGEAGN